MNKTTLYLDPDAYRKLKRMAGDARRSPASLVREAVAEYVARHGAREMPKTVGAFRSGHRDLSERAEDLLNEFGERRPPRPRRGRR
jgi:hypothetical protein